MDNPDLELENSLTLQCPLMTCVQVMNGHPMLATVMNGHPMPATTLRNWPSHARLNLAQLQDEAGGQKKKGRGVLKGFKASKQRFANGSAKLNIPFSKKLGGTVGMNHRSF